MASELAPYDDAPCMCLEVNNVLHYDGRRKSLRKLFVCLLDNPRTCRGLQLHNRELTTRESGLQLQVSSPYKHTASLRLHLDKVLGGGMHRSYVNSPVSAEQSTSGMRLDSQDPWLEVSSFFAVLS